jgi:hypothetical protein
VLHIGWGLLFFTIGAVIAWAFNLAIAMWNHSRRWRAALEERTPLEQPSTPDIVGWALATAALLTLIVGLGCLAYVAVNVPQKASSSSRPTAPAATAPTPAAPASTASSRPSGF